MKISELLNITLDEQYDYGDYFDILEENLGNLQFIDHDLLPVLKASSTYFYNRFAGSRSQGGYQQTSSIGKKLPPALGKNSKIEDIPVKTGAALFKLISETAEVKVIVILAKGQQAFIVSKTAENSANHGAQSNYFWSAIFHHIFGDAATMSNNKDLAKLLEDANVQDVKSIIEQSPPKAKKAVSAVVKVLQQLFGNDAVTAKVIYADETLTDIRRKRKEDTSIPDNKKHLAFTVNAKNPKNVNDKRTWDADKWQKMVKTSLNIRLKTFKEHKLPDSESIEDLLGLLKKTGFLKTIKIQGLPYVLYETGLSLNALLDPTDTPYIAYKMDETTDEYHKMYEERGEARIKYKEEHGDDADMDEFYYMWAKKYPKLVKVVMKLNGANIEAVKIETR